MRNGEILLLQGKNALQLGAGGEMESCILGCNSLEWSVHFAELGDGGEKENSLDSHVTDCCLSFLIFVDFLE